MAQRKCEILAMQKKNGRKFMETAKKNVEKDMELLKKLAKH